MISRVTGILAEVGEGSALVDSGAGLWYEVLVPAFDIERLGKSTSQHVTLYTIHYVEGDPSHGVQTPRLIGFLTDNDRTFFKVFTSVKGIGVRKALRALVLPISEVASAIAAKDARLLVTLPEIGKRTADQIILELADKMAPFAAAACPQCRAPQSSSAAEAVSVLVQLGEKRADALALVERVLAVAPEMDCPEAILKHAYRLKSAGK